MSGISQDTEYPFNPKLKLINSIRTLKRVFILALVIKV